MASDRRKYLTDYQRDTLRKKKKRVELSLTPADHQTLLRAARAHQKKLSPFIITAALAYLEKRYIPLADDSIRELELQIRRIGTNLNQLARKANREGIETLELKEAVAVVQELETVVSDALRHPPDLLSLVQHEIKHNPQFLRHLQQLVEEALE